MANIINMGAPERSQQYIDINLLASGWNNGLYTISDNRITASSYQYITPIPNINADKLAVLQAANLQDGGQTTGQLIIKAYGDVPTEDIPIRVVFERGVELLKNTVGMDAVPTAGSTNAVQSNGIVGSLDTKVNKSGDTMTGALIIKKQTAASNTYEDTNPKIIFQNANANQNASLTFTDYDSVQSPASITLNGNQGGEYFIAPNIKAISYFYGALSGNATTATTLQTARAISLGQNFQGSANFDGSANITINGGFYQVDLTSSNTTNYPFHRIATVSMGTGSWVDKDAIIDIRHKYNGGSYGRLKISARANNGTSSPKGSVDISAKWIYRVGMARDSVSIAKKGLAGENAYVDVFYKVGGSYARASVYQIEGDRTFTLIASTEVSNTTTSDKLTSVEVYTSVENCGTVLRGAAYDTIATATDSWLDNVYPIGSIYMSVNSNNPGTLFGGTWAQLSDRFLLGASSTYANGSTGGSTTMAHTHSVTAAGSVGSHTLTVAEMPSHGHLVRWWNDAGTQGNAYYYNGATKTNVTNGMEITNGGGIWRSAAFTAAQSGAGDQIGGADRVGGGGGHNHGFTGSAVTSGAASNTNNMPPYLAVYMWKRTA